MNINYPILTVVLLIVAALIIFIIRRNRKDQKDYEKESNQSELKPEKHDD